MQSEQEYMGRFPGRNTEQVVLKDGGLPGRRTELGRAVSTSRGPKVPVHEENVQQIPDLGLLKV
jgi:hypothetical protein